MSFDHLKLFKDIAHTRNLSRGAALNRISQSAASQHIQELESRLGVRLLDRSTRPLGLTPAGHLYLDLCRDVLRRKEEFEVALEYLKGAVEGTVRVASIYSIGLSEISWLKGEFLRRFPGASLDVQYLRPDKVYEAVLSGEADLGLVSYPEATKQIEVIPWREEQMVVAARPSHPLAAKQHLEVEDLNGQDFVAFDPDLPIRRHLDRFLRERRIEVNTTMHFDNIQMVKEAVAVGTSISIVPARVMRVEIEQGRLVAIPINAALVRPIGIAHRRRKQFSRAAKAFLELLQERPVPGPEMECAAAAT